MVQGGADARKSRLRWQNFEYRLFITSIILNGNMVISVVFSSVDRHCKKTTEMIRGEKRLYLKFCHLNRDVRAPAAPCTLLFSL